MVPANTAALLLKRMQDFYLTQMFLTFYNYFKIFYHGFNFYELILLEKICYELVLLVDIHLFCPFVDQSPRYF
jgi:hypothetical protein